MQKYERIKDLNSSEFRRLTGVKPLLNLIRKSLQMELINFSKIFPLFSFDERCEYVL